MIRATILALALLAAPESAAASPVGNIFSFAEDDLQAAIDLANKANPPDTVGAGCFTTIQTTIKLLGGAPPLTLHLASDFERLYLFHKQVQVFKDDVNCQAMCSRLAQITPLLSKSTPSFCDAANLLR